MVIWELVVTHLTSESRAIMLCRALAPMNWRLNSVEVIWLWRAKERNMKKLKLATRMASNRVKETVSSVILLLSVLNLMVILLPVWAYLRLLCNSNGGEGA